MFGIGLTFLVPYDIIQLITHICYTWIAHMMNTLNTKEKMDYLGLEGPEPTFEEIMKVNLEKGEISPPIPKPDEDATTNAHNSDGGKRTKNVIK